MMKHRLPYFLIPFTFLAASAFGSDTFLSCADKSIVAGAVRTQEDVQAFVQCAYEFVQEVSFAQARQAFNEDERWESGPILYLRVWSDPPERSGSIVRLSARPAEGRIQPGISDRHFRPRLLQGTASYRERLRRRLDFLLVPKSGDGPG